MLTGTEINLIGNLINTTWGRSSTSADGFPTRPSNQAAISAYLAPERGAGYGLLDADAIEHTEDDSTTCTLVVNYVDVVTFRSWRDQHIEMRDFRQLAEARVEQKIKELKQAFKGESGRALKLKLRESHDSVEPAYAISPVVSNIVGNTRRVDLFRGFYRFVAVYRLS
jgi:hypothetical protein